MFCQNEIIFPTLKQMTKGDRLNPWKYKISCKPAQTFVKCSHLNLPPFFCPQNRSALFVGHASTFIICSAINFHCVFLICERK